MKDSGPRPKFAAILLLDSAGQVGHVGVRRLDQPTDWAAVWQAATAGENPYVAWALAEIIASAAGRADCHRQLRNTSRHRAGMRDIACRLVGSGNGGRTGPGTAASWPD